MKIEVTLSDANLAAFTRMLQLAGEGKARRALADALNRAGEKGRTEIRRALVKQTGLRYGWVSKGMKTRRAYPGRLEYTISQSGDETNLNLFKASQRAFGVQASPWSRTAMFRGAFLVPKWGRKVYQRTGSARHPVKQLWGPNTGREVIKHESRQAFENIPSNLQPAIERVLIKEFQL